MHRISVSELDRTLVQSDVLEERARRMRQVFEAAEPPAGYVLGRTARGTQASAFRRKRSPAWVWGRPALLVAGLCLFGGSAWALEATTSGAALLRVVRNALGLAVSGEVGVTDGSGWRGSGERAVSDPAVRDPAVRDPAVRDPAVRDPAVSDRASVGTPAVDARSGDAPSVGARSANTVAGEVQTADAHRADASLGQGAPQPRPTHDVAPLSGESARSNSWRPLSLALQTGDIVGALAQARRLAKSSDPDVRQPAELVVLQLESRLKGEARGASERRLQNLAESAASEQVRREAARLLEEGRASPSK